MAIVDARGKRLEPFTVSTVSWRNTLAGRRQRVLLYWRETMMNPKGRSAPMSDIPKTPPESTPVLDMPWVLISNQIQQLNDNMNQRFNDERLRMDDRFAALERNAHDRFAALDQRFDGIDQRMDKMDQRMDKMDQRMDKVDHRFDKLEQDIGQRFTKLEQDVDQRFTKLEHRLEFRVSTWLAIILAALTLIIGVLLGHPVSW